MQITIDIKNCKECPYSSCGDTKHPPESWVCDKLQDNIGSGDGISDRCPLRKQAIWYKKETEVVG